MKIHDKIERSRRLGDDGVLDCGCCWVSSGDVRSGVGGILKYIKKL